LRAPGGYSPLPSPSSWQTVTAGRCIGSSSSNRLQAINY
jgi:hypothetical protein